MLFADYKIMKIQQTLDFHGVSKWHTLGFKGQGVRVLNLEDYWGHGHDTFEMIKVVVPLADIHWCGLSYGLKSGVLYSFSATTKDGVFNIENFTQWVKTFDVITVSMHGTFGDELNQIFANSGAVIMSSAGNDGDVGVRGRFKDIGFSVGAIYYQDGIIRKQGYSSVGAEVDFACLHGHLEGTSFSSPVLAGLVALITQRYGRLTMANMETVLKSISIDAGDTVFDHHFGWGVPVLPLHMTVQFPSIPIIKPVATPLEIEKAKGGTPMNFSDVKQDRWSAEAIMMVTEKRIMQGFTDGTFDPTAPLTREQFATVIMNLFKLGVFKA
jgi:hypothetical protein